MDSREDTTMAKGLFEPWQTSLVDELRVAGLGTIQADGRPHLVPVCYARAGQVTWIPVDEKPKSGATLARLRNIARDPRVTLLFDRYDDDWSRLAWVRIDGEARVFAAGIEAPSALAALRQRYAQYREMRLEALPLIAVTPSRVAGWRWTAG